MRIITDIDYVCGANPAWKLDLYLPDLSEKPNRVFLYLHGGGLEGGDKSDAAGWAESLTCQGIALASANYRMYPGAHFPEFIQDCAQAVSWLVHSAGAYLDAERLFVGGSSAGGYATANATAPELRGRSGRKRGSPSRNTRSIKFASATTTGSLPTATARSGA